MPATTLISVDEYLNTTYRPDCDYVDGEVIERNLGERPHSKLQGELLLFFGALRKSHRLFAYPEQRLQVSPTRFRIPDVLVLAGEDWKEPVFFRPPFIAIEILSRDDSLGSLHERVTEYRTLGVPHVWILDPIHRIAWNFTDDGFLKVRDGALTTDSPAVELRLAELFSSLD